MATANKMLGANHNEYSDIQIIDHCDTSFSNYMSKNMSFENHTPSALVNDDLRAGVRMSSCQVLPIVTPAALNSKDFKGFQSSIMADSPTTSSERLRHTPIYEISNNLHDPLQSAMKSKRLFDSTVKARREISMKYSKIALRQIGPIGRAIKMRSWESIIKHRVKDVTMRVNSINAIKLRFNMHDSTPLFFLGQRDAPKAINVGKISDILDSLCCQGCDKTLICEKWIKNHYRWIVWKLAAMERRFPEELGGQYLTYCHVLSQMKCRYEKEICAANRPAVRKILNRDVSSCMPIILCVSQILRFKSKTPQNSGDQWAEKKRDEEIRLEVSDGWYALSAVLDGVLSKFVESGKIRVGSKLMICNAQLVGSEDGIDPLDDDYFSDRRNCRLVLQITANSTRLARWDAKLGFVHPKFTVQQGGGILVKTLRGIYPDGGTIPVIDLVICKCYPRMFLEQIRDNNNIVSNHLTEADEEARQNDYEISHQRASEKYADIAGADCSEVRLLDL